jgi:hypothetical protein
MSIGSTGLSKEERRGGTLATERPPHIEPLTCTVKDASRISGLGISTVWKLIHEDKLDTVLVYNRRLVLLPSLRKLLAPPTSSEA